MLWYGITKASFFCFRADKVGFLVIPKNQISLCHKPKPDLVHGGPLFCTIANMSYIAMHDHVCFQIESFIDYFDKFGSKKF